MNWYKQAQQYDWSSQPYSNEVNGELMYMLNDMQTEDKNPRTQLDPMTAKKVQQWAMQTSGAQRLEAYDNITLSYIINNQGESETIQHGVHTTGVEGNGSSTLQNCEGICYVGDQSFPVPPELCQEMIEPMTDTLVEDHY